MIRPAVQQPVMALLAQRHAGQVMHERQAGAVIHGFHQAAGGGCGFVIFVGPGIDHRMRAVRGQAVQRRPVAWLGNVEGQAHAGGAGVGEPATGALLGIRPAQREQPGAAAIGAQHRRGQLQAGRQDLCHLSDFPSLRVGVQQHPPALHEIEACRAACHGGGFGPHGDAQPLLVRPDRQQPRPAPAAQQHLRQAELAVRVEQIEGEPSARPFPQTAVGGDGGGRGGQDLGRPCQLLTHAV